MFRTGVRQGLKRLWPAVCGILTPLGPPKGGNHQSAVAGAAGHLSGKPGRRGVFEWLLVMGYWLLKRYFDTMVVNGGNTAPGRPN